MLHDENYKRLFASKLMVEHLLRACLPADLQAVADFSELDELSTEYVSDELRTRHGDTVWRKPAQGYFLLDLWRVTADDVPGRNLLRAVAAVEQSRSFEDVLRVREALQPWLRDPRAAELLRAFVDWMRQIAERMAPPGAVVPRVRTLEEMRMSVVERAAEWPKQWLREGREQGITEGREQGIEQGIEQGVDQQRALLCRQAERRFGAETAARLSDVLAPIADPDRLAEVGDWLVRCNTGAEFLARVDPSSPS